MYLTKTEQEHILNTLQAALTALNTAPRFNVGLSDSYQIASQCEKTIDLLENKKAAK